MLGDDSQTIIDADFTNVTLIEKLTTGDGTNNLTLGTKADGSVLKTVTGGGGVDTIDASAFTVVLTISSGGGNDVITTKLVLWLSQLMPVLTMTPLML